MDAMFFIVLGATLVSFLLTLAFGRFVIPMLRALHAGQSIREVGPQWHNSKSGTPTMGGIMFIAAILLCTVGFGWKSMVENGDYTHLYVLGLALCYGLVGFADDFVKVKLKRNLGLTASQKFLLQLVVAVIFLFVLKKSGDLSCDLYIPFWNLDLEIPTAVYMIFAAFVIVGCVNAVNLTDGVDGLSSSVTIPVMVFFAATAYIYGRTTLALLPATVAGGLAVVNPLFLKPHIIDGCFLFGIGLLGGVHALLLNHRCLSHYAEKSSNTDEKDDRAVLAVKCRKAAGVGRCNQKIGKDESCACEPDHRGQLSVNRV